MIHSTMSVFDRAGEYLRLRDQYQGLSDSELLDLGQELSELTEIAQQALTNEISRRGLKLEPQQPSVSNRPEPPPDIQDPNDPNYDEDRKLVSIATVWSFADALQLQDLLDRAGIPFYMGPEKATSADAVTSNFAEGVAVQIMSIGLPWARLAMKDYLPVNDEPHVNEEDLDEVPVRCPKCHSSEVFLEETEPVKGRNLATTFQMGMRFMRNPLGGRRRRGNQVTVYGLQIPESGKFCCLTCCQAKNLTPVGTDTNRSRLTSESSAEIHAPNC